MSNVDPTKTRGWTQVLVKNIYSWTLEDTVNIEYKTNKKNKQNKHETRKAKKMGIKNCTIGLRKLGAHGRQAVSFFDKTPTVLFNNNKKSSEKYCQW